MMFQKPPQISRRSIDRAGDILISGTHDEVALLDARNILTRWRACHAYPINTFQATLRTKVRNNRFGKNPIIAQRLKRAPTIIAKLREGRKYDIKLLNMQDIAGVRAILPSVNNVRKLEKEYRRKGRFEHVLHPRSPDYIQKPKGDGYRSIHLIYKYQNKKHPEWNGLWVELQIRTRLQHNWATAVEAVHTFLDKAIKTRQGQKSDEEWANFFRLVSSAFAIIEKTPPVSEHQELTPRQILEAIRKEEKNLKVIDKLKAFHTAMDIIIEKIKRGHYHLIVLNTKEKRVTVKSFGRDDFEVANLEYAQAEGESIHKDEVEAVLVSSNEVEKAYPSFFADTKDFIRDLQFVLSGDWIK